MPTLAAPATTARIAATIASGDGVLRLLPTWVPRRFGQPGRRLRLHPDDYFALGMARGAIKERWLSSVIAAQNGPLAAPDEGMSQVLPSGGDPAERFTLKEAHDACALELLGDGLLRRHGGWPMYAKFFDYDGPLFHHLHLAEDAARRVGRRGKPEAYFFPPQMNNHLGSFPVSYFGFSPEVTRAQVRERLERYESGDNRITELSRAFRIELGTGWYTPPGVVHAPGSALTYEPQWNSDVNSVYENVAAGECYPREFLVENCPPERQHDLDYVLSLMDWQANVDPEYRRTYFRPPRAHRRGDGYEERWIVYGNPWLGALELSVAPLATVTIADPTAYGCIVIQGHGRLGAHAVEAATMLRFGQPSADECFVGHQAASAGLRIENRSACEPLVMLKHFGSGHPGMP